MASSSSMVRKRKYDVFLSFRGEDTRDNFTSHLYNALCRKKVKTFIDNDLERGNEITPALLSTIEESIISVIIFSKNYASSPWCLDEMSKILECKDSFGQIVLPIFYHIDPSHLQEPSGSSADIFNEIKKNFKEKTVKILRWRVDLMKAASISGWDSQVIRPEAKLVDDIVKDIMKKLNYASFKESKGLVGIDSHIERVGKLLCFGSSDVRIIGIWGIGGIGKTTIAEALFNSFSSQYEGRCFLKNIKDELTRWGLNFLKQKLLCEILEDGSQQFAAPYMGSLPNEDRLHHTRAFIVLDDVDDVGQLDSLVGSFNFGLGSRIIVTSRDRQVLKHIVDAIYEVEGLNDHEALQLFSLNAFKKKCPPKDRTLLSNKVTNYAQGNPLALKVLGLYLFDRSNRDWESAIDKLGRSPHSQICKVLRISFDTLDDEEKTIFLDIACFFKGHQIDFVKRILDGCGFSADIGISILVDRCLITVVEGKLGLHDLLQEMAFEIVRQESVVKLGKRSRLWNPIDILQVLTKNLGTENIEGIFLDASTIGEVELSSEVFVKMVNLRLLKIYNARVGRNNKLRIHQGLEFPSYELRYLHWDGYPLRSLPSNFQAEKLVQLNLTYSNVEQLWTGVQSLVSLKDIDLSHCEHLTTFPDLSQAKNLERINFENCPSLVEVSSSIQFLDHLVDLNMKSCRSLMHLPIGIKSRSLKTVNLAGCSNFRKCPEFAENIRYLNLSETAIEELPKSVENLSRLITLNLKGCKQLTNLPESVYMLKSLLILDLSGCSDITNLPDLSTDIRYLYLSGTAIDELPSSIGNLLKLSCLDLKNCRRLKNIHFDMRKLASLENLILSGCQNITQFPDVSGKVKKLVLDETAVEEIPSSVQYLFELEELSMQKCKRLQTLPTSICKLKRLQKLNLSGCSMFEEFPEVLEVMGSLRYLYLDGTAITKLPSPIENFKVLSSLEVRNCKNLSIFPEMKMIVGIEHFSNMPDMGVDIQYLSKLYLTNCRLSNLPYSICGLFSLEALDLGGNNFVTLPNTMNKLSELQYLGLRNCMMLTSLPDLPPRLEKLDAHNCFSLKKVFFNSAGARGKVFNFLFTNCAKLLRAAHHDIMAYVLTKFLRFTKELHAQMLLPGESSFYMDGYIIPRWLSHQSIGCSTTIQLPSQWANIKFFGFILCANMVFDNHFMGSDGFQVRCSYHLKYENGGECSDVNSYFSGWYGLTNPSLHSILFFGCDPLVDVRKGGDWCKYRKVVVKFYPEDMDGNPLQCCKVKKCGVRILYSEEEILCQCPRIDVGELTNVESGPFAGCRANGVTRYINRPFGCFNVGDEEDVDSIRARKMKFYLRKKQSRELALSKKKKRTGGLASLDALASDRCRTKKKICHRNC